MHVNLPMPLVHHWLFVDKRRPKPNVAEAMNVIGEVEGKTVIVIDDIVDTAGSLVASINILKR